MRGIHRPPVNSPHKGPVTRSFDVSLMLVKANSQINRRAYGDLRPRCAHCDVIVMTDQVVRSDEVSELWGLTISFFDNKKRVTVSRPFLWDMNKDEVRSRKASKPQDVYLELCDRSEIWQARRQQCCLRACQISKRCDDFNYQSRGFESSRNLMIRRLIGYWNGALMVTKPISFVPSFPRFQNDQSSVFLPIK